MFSYDFLYQRAELEQEDSDQEEPDDERPTVVVLRKGDLTAEEAERHAQSLEGNIAQQGRVSECVCVCVIRPDCEICIDPGEGLVENNEVQWCMCMHRTCGGGRGAEHSRARYSVCMTRW